MSRRFGTLLLAFALCLTLRPVDTRAGVLEDVKERGTLRIGVATFVPWTFRNKDGALEGHEIDIGERLASDIGVTPEFIAVPWPEIIDRLVAGEFDVIAAGMAITPERAMRINFSNPYFESGITLATNIEATADFDSLQAVNDPDVKIAVVDQTFAAGLAPRLFDKAAIATYPDTKAARAAVLAAEASVYLTNLPEATFFSLTHPDKIDLPTGEPLVRSSAGFAVNKGAHDWLAFLNAWIVARKADLFIDSTFRFWFQNIDWKDRVADGAAAE